MSRTARTVVTALSWRTWRRQLASAPAVPLSLAVATFVTAGCLAFGPRIIDHASVHDLRAELADASAQQRNLRIEQTARIGVNPTGEPLDTVRRQGTSLLDDARPSITSTIDSQRFVVDSPRFTVVSYPDEGRGPFPTTFQFRSHDGIGDHMELVAGELPSEQQPRRLFQGGECPEGASAAEFVSDPDDDVDCDVIVAPVFDTLISADTATAMRLEVGDEVILIPDPLDIRWRQATGEQFGRRFVLRIAGLAEFSDPALEYWYGDTALHRPRITENADYRLIFSYGLLSEDHYQNFLRATVSVPLTYTWRYAFDIDRITPELAPDLAVDVERLNPTDAVAVTQLPDLIRTYLDQRSLTVGLMSAVISGLYAVTAGGLAALALLGAIRHRATTHLVLDRGGTRRQVLIDAGRTGLLVAVPAAFAGWLVGRLALPETDDGAPLVLAVITAAIALATAIGAGIAIAGERAVVNAARKSGAHPGRRRIVAELFVVVLAVAVAVLVRRRGADDAAQSSTEVDPLLAVAATVVVFAAALAVVRVAALVVKALAAVAARRRGTAGFIGTRRASAQVRSMAAALVVMIGAIAIAAFATTVNGSIDRTQQTRSWAEVGGDFRVETRNPTLALSSMTDLGQIPEGPSAAAVVYEVSAVGPLGGTFAELTALATGDYLDGVAAGRSDVVDATLLERLRVATQGWDPDSASPMPALVSTRWPASTAIRLGDRFTMGLGEVGGATNYYALALADSVPGIDTDRPFVVVDRGALSTRIEVPAADTNMVVGRASREAVDQLIADVAAETGQVLVRSRYDAIDEIAGDPFSTWLGRALAAVVVLAGAVAALAAVAAFEISAAERDRDLSVLRTLGARRRDAIWISVVEQLPNVVTATVFGTLAGLATAWLLQPALRLGRLAGTDAAVGPVIDVVEIVAVAGSFAAVMTVAVGVSVWRQTRRNDGSMLRTGGDR